MRVLPDLFSILEKLPFAAELLANILIVVKEVFLVTIL